MQTFPKFLILLGITLSLLTITAFAGETVQVRQLFYCAPVDKEALKQLGIQKAGTSTNRTDFLADLFNHFLNREEDPESSVIIWKRLEKGERTYVIRRPFTVSNVVFEGESICGLLTKDGP